MADRQLIVPSWRPGRWNLTLDSGELRALVGPLREWMSFPDSAPLELTDPSGQVHDHAALSAVTDEAIAVLDDAVSRPRLRRGLKTSDLLMISAAAQNLGVVAYLAGNAGAPTDELVMLCEQLVVDLLVTLDRRFTPAGDGTFVTHWTATDRAVIDDLAAELEESLGGGDPDLARLFPPAYLGDAERSQGYAALAGAELIESRRASLAVLRDAIQRETATEDEMAAMMRAVNDLRLVLGTRLDVSETDEGPPPGHPDAPAYAVYRHLTHLLAQIIEALRAAHH
jgi:Domain of unknown function (DUF2017)